MDFTDESTTTVGLTAWSWDFGNGQNSTLQNPSTVYPDTGTFVVQLTAVDGGGCITDTNIQVHVQGPLGTFDLSATDGCGPEDTVIATATTTPGIASYDWGWDIGTTTTTEPTDSFIYTSVGQYTVGLTLTDTAGCTYTLPTTQEAVLSNVLEASVAGPIVTCTGEPSTLTVSATTNSALSSINNYTWQFGDNSPPLSTANPSVTHTYPEGSYDLELTLESSDGCSITFKLPEWVFVTRPRLTINDDTIVCPESIIETRVEVDNPDFGPYAYAWSCNTPTCPGLSNSAVQDFTVNAPAVLSVEVTDTAGCSETISRSLTTYDPPVIDAGSDKHVCEGDSVTLDAQILALPSPLESIHWTPGSSLSFSQSLTPTASPTQSTNYIIRIVDENTCTGSDTVFVDYTPTPSADIIGPDTACPFELITLTAQGGSSWLWSTGETTQRITFRHETIDRNFSVVPTANGCVGVKTLDTVFVARPLPVAHFFVKSAPPHWLKNPVAFESYSENALQLLWDFADGNSSSTTQPEHTYNRIGTYDVQLTAIGEHGCRDTTSFPVHIQLPFVRMPNAFSPNDDVLNEELFPIINGVAEVKMQIYSRWGEILFDGSGRPPRWDGTDLSGQPVPEGVYVWVIEGLSGTGQPFTQTGTVTVVR